MVNSSFFFPINQTIPIKRIEQKNDKNKPNLMAPQGSFHFLLNKLGVDTNEA